MSVGWCNFSLTNHKPCVLSILLMNRMWEGNSCNCKYMKNILNTSLEGLWKEYGIYWREIDTSRSPDKHSFHDWRFCPSTSTISVSHFVPPVDSWRSSSVPSVQVQQSLKDHICYWLQRVLHVELMISLRKKSGRWMCLVSCSNRTLNFSG